VNCVEAGDGRTKTLCDTLEETEECYQWGSMGTAWSPYNHSSYSHCRTQGK
jgi:hypothetical protein